MACCLFLLRLLAPLTSRLGLGDPTARPPRFPLVPAAGLGLVEVAAAWLIVSHHESVSSGMGAMPMVGMQQNSMHVQGAMSSTTGPGLGPVLGSAVAGLALVVVGVTLARRGRAPIAWCAAVLGTALAAFAVRPQVAATHVLLMAVVEIGLVVVPLAIVGTARHDGLADDVWVVVRLAIASVAAASATFLLVTLHLPSTQNWYRTESGPVWWLAPALLTAGLAFWASVLRFRLPVIPRTLLLVLVLETGAVIGLALMVSSHPIMEMSPAFGLGVLADQRLAGALMMVVDLVVLAWVIEPQFTGSSRTSVRPSTSISIAT